MRDGWGEGMLPGMDRRCTRSGAQVPLQSVGNERDDAALLEAGGKLQCASHGCTARWPARQAIFVTNLVGELPGQGRGHEGVLVDETRVEDGRQAALAAVQVSQTWDWICGTARIGGDDANSRVLLPQIARGPNDGAGRADRRNEVR